MKTLIIVSIVLYSCTVSLAHQFINSDGLKYSISSKNIVYEVGDSKGSDGKWCFYSLEPVQSVLDVEVFMAETANGSPVYCVLEQESVTQDMFPQLFNGKVVTNSSVVETYDAEESFDIVPELVEFKKAYPKIINLALKLVGRIRSGGVHAAGIVTSAIPLDQLSVIEHRAGGFCVNWDKGTAEDTFCLLKLDCLGLKTVDVIEGTLRLLKSHENIIMTDEDIPLNDQRVEQEIAKGNTSTIFQFEGSNAKRLLKEGGNGCLDVLSAVSATNRPGPLQAKDDKGVNITTRYIECVAGSRVASYVTPELEPILNTTYGELVYQEQIMKTVVALAGFTLPEADTLRKIIGKKLGKDALREHSKPFIEGCVANNIDADIAKTIFDQIVEFAAYSFNLAHSVAYGIISMESMWLKVNYPLYYFTSVLTFAGKDDMFQEYIKDAKRYGVDVKYPCINDSQAAHFSVHNGAIIAPLTSIKGVGVKAADEILRVRKAVGGLFMDHAHFINSITEFKAARTVNVRVKDCLFKADSFAYFGHVVEDKEERQENLRMLLSLFSPIPTFKPKGGRTHDKAMLAELYTEVDNCRMVSYDPPHNMVDSIVKAKGNIMVLTGLSAKDSKLLARENTSWIKESLMDHLGIPNADINFVSPVKCDFYGVQPNELPKACTDKCSREFLKREIEILRPRLIICCHSPSFNWLTENPDLRFMECIGNIYWSGLFECSVIPAPSPQYVSFDTNARELWSDAVVPLLKKCYDDGVEK